MKPRSKRGMSSAFLTRVDLREADLSEADLGNANLGGADLSNANLTGVDLTGANLKSVTGISIERLEKKAKSLKGATMPDGSIHP